MAERPDMRRLVFYGYGVGEQAKEYIESLEAERDAGAKQVEALTGQVEVLAMQVLELQNALDVAYGEFNHRQIEKAQQDSGVRRTGRMSERPYFDWWTAQDAAFVRRCEDDPCAVIFEQAAEIRRLAGQAKALAEATNIAAALLAKYAPIRESERFLTALREAQESEGREG